MSHQQDDSRPNRQLGSPILPLAHDLRSCLLRRRNDAFVHPALRPRSHGHHFPCLAPPVGRHDRRRHPDQQDGARAAPGLRPDARAALGHLHGLVCQRRRVLPLQLQRGAGVRSDCARGCVRSRLPAYQRGAHVWYLPAAEEDEDDQDYEDVVQEVEEEFLLEIGIHLAGKDGGMVTSGKESIRFIIRMKAVKDGMN